MNPARIGDARRPHRALAPAVVALAGLTALAGCEVKLDPGLPDPVDAIRIDAPIDAPAEAMIDAPIDARACAGGDARITEPTTGACFLLFVAAKTHANAQADCAANASHLAIITTPAVNTALTNLIGAREVFLGATDAVVEGTYVWVDGTGLVFSNFRSGEPNNGGGQFQEDCLVLEGQRGGTWDDRPCAPPPAGSGVLSYVCQFAP